MVTCSWPSWHSLHTHTHTYTHTHNQVTIDNSPQHRQTYTDTHGNSFPPSTVHAHTLVTTDNSYPLPSLSASLTYCLYLDDTLKCSSCYYHCTGVWFGRGMDVFSSTTQVSGLRYGKNQRSCSDEQMWRRWSRDPQTTTKVALHSVCSLSLTVNSLCKCIRRKYKQ